jgi:hypothetical protein
MLRNRKEIAAKDLQGVRLETAPSNVQFGYFTRLENWTAAGIGSIKKKRGVELAMGGPPPQANEEICPEVPTVVHIDDGFQHITLAEFTLDLVGLAAFYGSTLNSAITRFDLNGLTVTHTTDGNGRLWQWPAFGPDDGDLYAQDFTLGGGSQRIVQLNPADLSEIRVSDVISGLAVGGLAITDTVIYSVFNSAFVNKLFCINKSDFSVAFSMGGIDGRYGGFAVDGSGNLWVHGRTTPSISKVTPAGVVTTYSLSSVHSAGVGLTVRYDDVNHALVIFGLDGKLSRFDIATETLTDSGITTFDGTRLAVPVDGKIWNAGTTMVEYQISDWSVLQTVPVTEIVGGVALSWQNAAFLTSLNCMHLAHGQIGGSDGGVDRLCLTCP